MGQFKENRHNFEEVNIVNRTIQGWNVGLFILALGIFWGASNEAGAANEARCAELGANCICSENLNSTSYSMAGGTNWGVHDNTTTTKECGIDGVAGAFLTLSGGGGISAFNSTWQAVSSGESVNALPAGHTNTYVLKNNGGGQFVGTNFQSSDPAARRSIRFYRYYSPTYTFQSDTGSSCNGNKIAQFFPGPVWTIEGGAWSFYGTGTSQGAWDNTDASVNCCSGLGPGNTGTAPTTAQLKGKWLRYEAVIHNAKPGMSPSWFEAYVKNVTDNTPEVRVIDTRIPKNFPDGGNWTTSAATNLHPAKEISGLVIDLFHQQNGSTPCQGYNAVSHFLAAAWSTDSGQRIGAAVEIEGGGGGNITPPAPPINLKFSLLSVEE